MARSTPQRRVARERILQKLEQMLLRGVTNGTTLAAAFGVSPTTIIQMIKHVEKRWKESISEDREVLLTTRIKQLEHVAHLALKAFDESRSDAKEVVVSQKLCDICDGSGIRVDGNKKTVCPLCGGEGRIVLETRKTKGQPGDPAFLSVAKSVFELCAKLQGFGTSAVGIGKVITSVTKSGDAVGGEIQQRIEEVFYEVPTDLLIKAKAILDDIRIAEKRGEVKVVEGKVIKQELQPEQDEERTIYEGEELLGEEHGSDDFDEESGEVDS